MSDTQQLQVDGLTADAEGDLVVTGFGTDVDRLRELMAVFGTTRAETPVVTQQRSTNSRAVPDNNRYVVYWWDNR